MAGVERVPAVRPVRPTIKARATGIGIKNFRRAA
jgi:hypothetical protein